jgi:hypothetical protein
MNSALQSAASSRPISQACDLLKPVKTEPEPTRTRTDDWVREGNGANGHGTSTWSDDVMTARVIGSPSTESSTS